MNKFQANIFTFLYIIQVYWLHIYLPLRLNKKLDLAMEEVEFICKEHVIDSFKWYW